MSALLTVAAMGLGFGRELRIAQLICDADRLIANGMDADAAAESLGVRPATMAQWRENVARAERRATPPRNFQPAGLQPDRQPHLSSPGFFDHTP